MADWFMSITADYDTISKDPDHVGSSSTAADKIEFRVDQALTQRQALNGIARFVRWIEQNGLNGLGANLPANRG
jgi:hypothetical protein